MPEIIDLSQEIYAGMTIFPGLPHVDITVHVTHEQWDGIADSHAVSPMVHRTETGESIGYKLDENDYLDVPSEYDEFVKKEQENPSNQPG